MMPMSADLKRAMRAVAENSSERGDMAGVISGVPGLLERIVTYAHVFYPRITADLSSPDRALSLLGARVLREITVQHVIASRVRGLKLPREVLEVLWFDLAQRGVAARVIAGATSVVNGDAAFTAGICLYVSTATLLAETGEYVAWYHRIRRAPPSERGGIEAEVFGITTEDAYSRDAEEWAFPPEINEAILIRNHLGNNPEPADLVSVCYWADLLCAALSSPTSRDDLNDWVERVSAAFGCSEDHGWVLVRNVADGMSSAAETLDVALAAGPPVNVLRERSALVLDHTTMTAEEIGCWTSLLESQVDRLKGRITALQESMEDIDGCDPLTGMLCIRPFLDVLEREVAQARVGETPLWLLLVDIDDFCVINVEDGYDIGDGVLKSVAGVMRRLLPGAREMARVGPDAMVAILTGDEWRIRLTAERTRAAVETARMQVQGRVIRATVSICVLGLEGMSARAGHEQFLGTVMVQQRGRKRRSGNQITWGGLSPV